ncbi:MAG: GspH/FimT family pseudopilin [Panacagrimonas sp.]
MLAVLASKSGSIRSAEGSSVPSARAGFTLIELMVTIAVFAILSALATPGFREVILNNQRATRINELLTDLAYARSEAVGTGRQVVTCSTSTPQAPVCGNGDGWEEGWVVFADLGSDPNGDYDDGEPVLRRREAMIPAAQRAMDATEKFTLRSDGEAEPGTAARVVFEPSGMSRTAGSIMACDARDDPQKGRQIVVLSGGRVRSVAPGDDASCFR